MTKKYFLINVVLLISRVLCAVSEGHVVSISNAKNVSSREHIREHILEEQFDEYKTRYRLVQSNTGSYNWLFVPGGAGADSSYFLPMLEVLKLPGKVWLIDFPDNGSNAQNTNNLESTEINRVFETWSDCLLSCVKKFENPVYVGHSFGGMFPLLFPELENLLKGLILIGASPVIDNNESEKMAKERNIVITSDAGQNFRKNPCDTTFKEALIARSPCHFPPVSLQAGQELFRTLPFNFKAMLWWVKKATDENYKASWVPAKVTVLILGGSEDCINPIVLFERDARFKRDNIELKIIQGSGHFPWLENREFIKKSFEQYILENLRA